MSRTVRIMLAAACALAAITTAITTATTAAAAGPTTADAGIDATLIGGDSILMPQGRCVIGFSGRDAAGVYIITSAPCYPGPGIAGRVRAPAGSTPSPYVRGPGGALLTVVGTTQAPVGARVCMSGPVGGYRCGVLQAKNQTVNFPGGVVTGLTRTSVCAYPGENGAPFVTVSGANAQGQGVLVGGSCSGGTGVSYFMPLPGLR